MKKVLFLIVSMVLTLSIQSQNIKPFIKAGDEFYAKGKFVEAIEQYSKAIELKPSNSNLYVIRAKSYEKNNDLLNAAEDYDNAITFDVKEFDNYKESARLYVALKEYQKAIDRCNEGYKVDDDISIIAIRYDAEMGKDTIPAALADAKLLLKSKESDINFYRLGKAQEKSGLDSDALKSFTSAVGKNKNNVEALTALANMQIKAKDQLNALNNVNSAIKLNSKYSEAYRVRAKIYSEQLKVAEVINDISTVILLEPEIANNYYNRGIYYQSFAQHQNAINDFTKVIALEPQRADAYFGRAHSYEQINNYKQAIKDYEALKNLEVKTKDVEALIVLSQTRLFELNRESDKPIVTIITPKHKGKGNLMVPNRVNDISIKGEIKEQSSIKSFTINNQPVLAEKNDELYEFTSNLTLSSDTITLTITDVYENSTHLTYSVFRTEIDTPTVNILAPYASDNNTIFLDNTDPKLYVEGKVTDESLIASIYIDGVVASFIPQEQNPGFQAFINVNNKDRFTVTVEDVFGNKSQNTYILNREGATIAAGNPMGKTWVVFVENSNYQNFANLEGPTKDVSLMKQALVKYNVNNMIHKKDMTKLEMERFFSIELRDLVKSNNVNSILIWYAGHGKYLNETGYWVATDAKRDDEFTYYNISSLKSSLNSYNITVDHTLVITDACESGPSFYQAMRSELKDRNCSDLSSKMKSSQVFSSAGYELAVDNSQFTKTFANTLLNSQDACLPIESVVRQVTKAVEQNNQQKPLFGKIAGLGDEDGTFFFIAK